MAVKNIIAPGIGFSPGLTGWILTRGLGAFSTTPATDRPASAKAVFADFWSTTVEEGSLFSAKLVQEDFWSAEME